MSLTITAYHIERGASQMFPVDAASAVGLHPHEWSRVPWTDEMKAKAGPKLKEKREAQAKEIADSRNASDALSTYDPGGFKVVSPIAGQTGQAPAGMQAGDDPHTPPYAEDEAKAGQVKQLEKDKAFADSDLDAAKADLDAAKGKNDEKATTAAQKRADAAQKASDEASAKLADASK